jgi:HlyD family secretion protein
MKSLSLNLTGNKHIKKVADALNKAAASKLSKDEIKEDIITKGDLPAPPVTGLENEYHTHYRRGIFALTSTVALVTVFTGLLPISGAVVVPGTFAVHSNIKKIQHKTGGTVKQIAVHDGSRVKTGDTLILLDDNDTQAQNTAVARQIDETYLKIARLTAERDGGKVLIPDRYFSAPADYQKLTKPELDFFKARQQTQASIQKLADNRVAQLEKQIVGLEAQFSANKRQKNVINAQLSGLEVLYRKKIATVQQLAPLQREQARLEGADGQIEASIQESRNKISEIKIQAQQSLENFRADVMHDLSDTSSKIGQLLEQYIITSQALRRTEIIAPVSGVVHELSIHTIGGTVSPAETLMTVVPENEPLEVTTKLPSDKIDQVKVGQAARVRLPALTRTTPDIHGAVNFVSPDLVETNKGSYYEVRVTVDQHPRGINLTPGMPAEVFLTTDDRTILSYLWKPIGEQLSRTFVER